MAQTDTTQSERKIDYDAELNTEQLDAVTTTKGPLRIIAGAGSGKTRTLIYRTAYMLEHGIYPYHILLLTFTNKAAGEMKSRLHDMLGDMGDKVTACTFHSWCSRILRRYAKEIPNISEDFTIIDTVEAADAIQRAKADLGFDKVVGGFPNSRQIYGYISTSINTMRSLEECITDSGRIQATDYIPEIKKVVKEYEQYKQSRNLMDYDDLLQVVHDTMRDDKGFRDRLSDVYRYVMVDEYQDTNAIQESIVMLLSEKYGNLCIVGDDYQSIYGWRGADVNNILEFAKKVPGTKDVVLHRNYRSDQRILDLSNASMREHASMGIYKEMRSDYDIGIKPVMYRVDDETEECQKALDVIDRCLNDGFKLSDIAVLERGSAYSYMLETRLTQRHIPYVKYGGQKFIERQHVQDVLAYVKCLVNPRNDLAFFRVLKLYGGIGDMYAKRISDEVERHGYDGLTTKYKKAKFHKDMETLQKKLREWQKKPLHDVLPDLERYYHDMRREVIMHAKYADESQRSMSLDYNDRNMLDFDTLNLLADGCKNASDFLDSIVLDAANPKDDDDCLRISTIHSAKGLEFPVVIMLRCARPELMDSYEPDSQKGQEELRCTYVALTRAKKRLYLIAPGMMTFQGTPMETTTIPALVGMEQYLDVHDERQRQNDRWDGRYQPYPMFGMGRERPWMQGIARDDAGVARKSQPMRKSVHGGNDGSARMGRNQFATAARGIIQSDEKARKLDATPAVKQTIRDTHFAVGDRVRHDHFGNGTVVSVDGDTIEVLFDGKSCSKPLMAGMAPMHKIG